MPRTSRIIEEMHESLQALDKLGLMEPQETAAIEAMYDACKVPQYSPENVKNLRTRLALTQRALASILNTSVSSVRQWEQGVKRPSGPSNKLLYLLDKKGMEALSVSA
ncbi:MAG: helix-turn-helix domain-containing protein [Desulfovibrionaceae bacterium]|nr:helix-turn-helix domain-containing protein [Desulfovibrionaceae bacterium]